MRVYTSVIIAHTSAARPNKKPEKRLVSQEQDREQRGSCVCPGGRERRSGRPGLTEIPSHATPASATCPLAPRALPPRLLRAAPATPEQTQRPLTPGCCRGRGLPREGDHQRPGGGRAGSGRSLSVHCPRVSVSVPDVHFSSGHLNTGKNQTATNTCLIVDVRNKAAAIFLSE